MIPDWAKELNCSITVCDKNGQFTKKIVLLKDDFILPWFSLPVY